MENTYVILTKSRDQVCKSVQKKSVKKTVVNLTDMLRKEDVGGDEDGKTDSPNLSVVGSRSRDYFAHHQHVLFKTDSALTRIKEYNTQIQTKNVLLSLNSLLFTISLNITSICDALYRLTERTFVMFEKV